MLLWWTGRGTAPRVQSIVLFPSYNHNPCSIYYSATVSVLTARALMASMLGADLTRAPVARTVATALYFASAVSMASL